MNQDDIPNNNQAQQNIRDDDDDNNITPSSGQPPTPNSPASQPSLPSLQQTNPTTTSTLFSFVVGPDGQLVTTPNTAAPSPGLANFFQSFFSMMNLPTPLANTLGHQNMVPTTLPQPPSAPELPTAQTVHTGESDAQPPQPPQNGLALSISFGVSRERERDPLHTQAPSPPGLYRNIVFRRRWKTHTNPLSVRS